MTKDTPHPPHTPNLSSPAHSLYPFTMVAVWSIDSQYVLSLTFNSNALLVTTEQISWSLNVTESQTHFISEYESMKYETIFFLLSFLEFWKYICADDGIINESIAWNLLLHSQCQFVTSPLFAHLVRQTTYVDIDLNGPVKRPFVCWTKN